MLDPIQMTHELDQMHAFVAEAKERFPDAARSSGALAIAYATRLARAVESRDTDASLTAMVALTTLGRMLIDTSDARMDAADPILSWIRRDGQTIS